MEAITFLNDFDKAPYRDISDQDRPHRVSASFIYELPVGKGRKYFRGMKGASNLFLGGWQYQCIYTYQSGQALAWGNIIFNGDLKNVTLPGGERTPDRWFNTDAGFVRESSKALTWNVRTFPFRFSGIRGDVMNNWDMSLLKNVTVREGMRLQFRFETLNAANHPSFANPSTDPVSTAFGVITSQRGYARRVQLGLKLIY
jgi:hypothetical protein